MDIYSFVKLLHILAATGWVGGAFLTTVLSELAMRSSGQVFQSFSSLAARIGGIVFIPSAILTLLFGVILTAMSWSFAALWILLALAGIAISMVMGVVLIKPTTERIAQLVEAEGPDSPQVRALYSDLLRFGRFELVLMVIVIADMVYKPGLDDIGTLLAFGVVLVAGAAVFLFRKAVLPPVQPATQ